MGPLLYRFYYHAQSSQATQSLARFLEIMNAHPDRFQYEVIDIAEHPEAAHKERLLALPMVLRVSPPICRYVGDLSNFENILRDEGVV